MDFDQAKENIQPLAQGRNPSILQASIREDCQQELLAKRKELEREIHNYKGDDPLSAWFAYIEWIEQSFPSGGKESGLQEVLAKCLTRFESDEKYFQDRRMIRMYIKYIDSIKDPAECYQQLYNAGIGTMVADLYIAWAYCYDLADNTRRADEIFRIGIACRAQPFEDIQEAHQHFGFSVAQRLMYKDDDNVKKETTRQLNERRQALSSLRGHRSKKTVGSIRTGAAIKNELPGTLKMDGPSTSQQRSNARIQVLDEENACPNVNTLSVSAEHDRENTGSVVRSIMDAQRDQENLKEPGPWNKPHKKGKLFSKTKLNCVGFEVHEDGKMMSDEYSYKQYTIKPIALPTNFCPRSRPQADWIVPITTEEKPDPNTLPAYNKCKLYPRPNKQVQPEEYKAYVFFKKRGVSNKFTEKLDIYLGRGPSYNVRLYPHFAKQSNPQSLTKSDQFYLPPQVKGLQVPVDNIYNEVEKIELQHEEILAKRRFRRNETIFVTADMEETICAPSEKVNRRKSFFPIRKSMAPSSSSNTKGAIPKIPILRACVEEEQHENKNLPTCSGSLLQTPAIFEEHETVLMPKLLSKITRQQNSEAATESTQDPERPNVLFKEKRQLLVQKLQKEVKMPDALPIKPLQSNVETPYIATEFKTSSGFSIFSEENNAAPPKIAVLSGQQKSIAASNDSEFQFKAPTLPLSTGGPLAKPNKLDFEIFEDNKSDNVTAKPVVSGGTSGGGGIFDLDESCSTQTFNIFLRAQSVSTPKPKTLPQKQFGNKLKDITSALSACEQPDEENPAKIDIDVPHLPHGDENCPIIANTAVFSPQQKQLSTILETSENATAQSTHTTGVSSTKSTLSSPEFDQEPQAQTNTLKGFAGFTLDTVRERSVEVSTTSPVQFVGAEANFNCLPIEVESKTDISRQNKQSPPCTPGLPRVESSNSKQTVGFGNLQFSVFEDPLEEKKIAGNFSRLEEKEDTTMGFKIKPVRFQDDKTETITKCMLAVSKAEKLQEDRTETIAAMMLAPPPQPIKFQEDKTDTITKFLLSTPAPMRYQEDDKTGTISKMIAPPPQPVRFEDEGGETLPQLSSLTLADSRKTKTEDDFFEFFSQSPPRLVKEASFKKAVIDNKRTAAESRTPFTLKTKRHCEKNSPNILKQAKPPMNFLKDSFMTDFSIIEESQPICAPTNNIMKPKSAVLEESFMPDFSLNKGAQNFAYVPETQQHKPTESESFIVDSRPSQSQIGKCNQENSLKKVTHSSSFLPDFSYIPETQETLGDRDNVDKASNMKNILSDRFMKDFSEINEPLPVPVEPPVEVKEFSILETSGKNSSTIKYLEETINPKSISSKTASNAKSMSKESNANKESKLSFLAPVDKSAAVKGRNPLQNENFFELNAETDMFGTDISMIKNSTWLPNHGPMRPSIKQQSQIQEESIHIKDELPSSSTSSFSATSSLKQNAGVFLAPKQIPVVSKIPKPKLSAFPLVSGIEAMSASRFSIEVNQSEIDAIIKTKKEQQQQQQQQQQCSEHKNSSKRNTEREEDDDFGEMSIYHKHTPKTPKAQVHVWEVEELKTLRTPTNNRYTHAEVDLNHTMTMLENFRMDPNINPFGVDVINAFLDQLQFTNYIRNIKHCMLVGCIQRLKANASIKINEVRFEVTKLIGEGAYGAVFLGQQLPGGKKVALKQEKPANLWEYYLCLEIQDRIRVDEMLPAYMSIDYALIGNNCSVFVSQFSPYGSIITVCNKIKKITLKNVDEYVVMVMACELLEIVDHLHAISIIHADIKADNILLMNKINYPSQGRSLQLIDFGVSIDMQLFKQNQTFSYIHTDNAFKCIEMRKQRPWTYQLDLYGLAGVLHVLLFGKYMDVEEKASGIWMHKTHVPRYFNKNLWDTIFKALLNIRDCNSMPNLQDLRALLKEEIEEKEKYVHKMVNEFNKALVM